MRFGDWLNKRHAELSIQEGRMIHWRELSERTGIPENTMVRWRKNLAQPSSIQQVIDLARVFGDGIFAALGIPRLMPTDLDDDLLFLVTHRNNKAVRAVIEQAKEKALENIKTSPKAAANVFAK